MPSLAILSDQLGARWRHQAWQVGLEQSAHPPPGLQMPASRERLQPASRRHFAARGTFRLPLTPGREGHWLT